MSASLFVCLLPGKKNRAVLYGCVRRAAAALLAAAVMLGAYSFAADCRGVRSKVLRLHIIANSDMLCDQEVKTVVRDRILSLSADIFTGCRGLDGAVAEAGCRLSIFTSAAISVLEEYGFDYGARAYICRDTFPTRVYGAATLPPGEYMALRVELGKGEGHNWWCVMFPMLCVPSSGGTGAEGLFNRGEQRVTELDGYDLRFRCAELFSDK